MRIASILHFHVADSRGDSHSVFPLHTVPLRPATVDKQHLLVAGSPSCCISLPLKHSRLSCFLLLSELLKHLLHILFLPRNFFHWQKRNLKGSE
jgi:hypothetical protein